MSEPSPANRAFFTARVLVAGAALLVLYWATQIALGVPDAYPGQTRGGFFLALALLMNSSGSLAEKPYLRIALPILSMVFLAASLYFVFG